MLSLVCSIAVIFFRVVLYFQASQDTLLFNKWKYTAISHTKTSNQRFIWPVRRKENYEEELKQDESMYINENIVFLLYNYLTSFLLYK